MPAPGALPSIEIKRLFKPYPIVEEATSRWRDLGQEEEAFGLG